MLYSYLLPSCQVLSLIKINNQGTIISEHVFQRGDQSFTSLIWLTPTRNLCRKNRQKKTSCNA